MISQRILWTPGFCWFAHGPLYIEAKERKKNGVDCSRLIGSSYKKKRSSHRKLAIGSHKISQPPPSACQNLKNLYRSFNWAQWLIPPRGSQHHTAILRLCSWTRQLVAHGRSVKCTFQGQGKEWRASDCLHPTHGSTRSQVPLMTTSNWHQPQWIYYAITMLIFLDN